MFTAFCFTLTLTRWLTLRGNLKIRSKLLEITQFIACNSK